MNKWDEAYQKKTHLSQWPWSDLVSLFFRHFSHLQGPKFKVLELGCGAGANIPLFASHFLSYHGIDGSPTIIQRLQEHYPQYKNQLHVGDFSVYNDYGTTFDLIIDRASLTCNRSSVIEKTIKNISSLLKPDGAFIGIDWYSERYSEKAKGRPIEGDPFALEFDFGPFNNIGPIHFSDQKRIETLFSDFNLTFLEHKTLDSKFPEEHSFCTWNFIAKQRKSYES